MPAVVTVRGALTVDTVGFAAEAGAEMLPESDALWMQSEGLLFGATQTVKVPTLKEAFGSPNTCSVYWPVAAGIEKVAVVAGDASVASPVIALPWLTTTVAELNAAGTCRSVNVTTRSSAVEIVKVSSVAAGVPVAPTSTVSGGSGFVVCAWTTGT